MSDKEFDIVEEAKTELVGMAKEGMQHPSTKPVLTGAAVGAAAGAVGGLVLPLVGWPVGLVAGTGYVLFNRIKR